MCRREAGQQLEEQTDREKAPGILRRRKSDVGWDPAKC
jgi:hypothetical protein